MIGTIMPRKLATPFRKAGALAIRGNSPVAARFLYFLDIDAIFFSANSAGEELHRGDIWAKLGDSYNPYTLSRL